MERLDAHQKPLTVEIVDARPESMTMQGVDARAKLMHIILTGAMLFFTKTLLANIVSVVLLSVLFCLYRKPTFALKMLVVYILFCGSSRLLLVTGVPALGAPSFFLFMISRFVPLSALLVLVTKTTGVSSIIQALQEFHLPRTLIIPTSVMFRFFPTVKQEIRSITDSMRMRSSASGQRSGISSPILTMEYLFVPLLMRSVKIAEELGASAVVRGIENPYTRTVYAPLRWQLSDTAYLCLILLIFALTFLIEKGVFLV
jgi:energy-coupling factor transport system permease protein